ncbi:MAG: hypothetical protein HZA01_02855 [Nitrospinae bacterium]|nr:hypothetical protein [Nitrospinota bacterium]
MKRTVRDLTTARFQRTRKPERAFMKAAKKKVSDMTVDELKTIIHEVVSENLEAWKETIEIMADKKLTARIKRADADWVSRKKKAYTAWEDLKRV